LEINQLDKSVYIYMKVMYEKMHKIGQRTDFNGHILLMRS
jgi:hypothetical protein